MDCPQHPGEPLQPKQCGWFCAKCADVIVCYHDQPHPPEDALPRADLAPIPFPVAYPLAFARDASISASARVDNLLFAAYQAMRVAALVLLSEYLAGQVTASDVEMAVRGLRMPHWQEWSTTADRLARHFSSGGHHSRFAALAEGWGRVSNLGNSKTPLGANLLAALPGNNGHARSLNDAVWKARNNRAHRMATRTSDVSRDAATLSKLLPVVELLVEALFVPANFRLLRRVGDGRWIELQGPHVDLAFATLPTVDVPGGLPSDCEIIALVGDSALSLFPMLAAVDEGLETALATAPQEPVLLLDGIRRDRVIMLGVSGHAESNRLVTPLLELLAKRSVDLGLARDDAKPWTIADWARANARQTLDLIRGSKYLPECYVEREGVDDVVDAWLGQTGKALLVVGEVGSGKSSLVARLVDRLTEPTTVMALSKSKREKLVETIDQNVGQFLGAAAGNDIVVYLSGATAFAVAGNTGHEALCNAVLLRAGVRTEAFRTLKDLFATLQGSWALDAQHHQRRVVLVLDAVDEADRFRDLVPGIVELLPLLGSYTWLRLIVSMRRGSYDALTSAEQGGGRRDALGDSRHWVSTTEARTGESQPFLEVRRFRAGAESRSAYERHAAAMPARSCSVAYDALPSGLRSTLASPLLLHLFHDTFKGATAFSPDLGDREIFDAYLDAVTRDAPVVRAALPAIGRLLYERRRPSLPVEMMDEWLADWRRSRRANAAEALARLDPIEELVAASLLLPPGEQPLGTPRGDLFYSFSHQRLCEQVLLRELRRQIAPRKVPTPEEMGRWIAHAAGPTTKRNDDFDELGGALESLCADLARASEIGALLPILDAPQESATRHLFEAVILALAASPKEDLAARATLAALEREAARTPTRASAFVAHGRLVVGQLRRIGRGWWAYAVTGAQERVLAAALESWPDRKAAEKSLATIRASLGRFAREQGDLDVALRLFEENLRECRRIAADGRVASRRQLSRALNQVGHLRFLRGDDHGARGVLEESLALTRTLAAAEPNNLDRLGDLAMPLLRLGSLDLAVGNLERGEAELEEAVASLRTVVEALSKDDALPSRLVDTLARLAESRAARGDRLALALLEEAQEIAGRSLDARPSDGDMLAAAAYAELAVLPLLALEARGRAAEAGIARLRNALAVGPDRVDLMAALAAALRTCRASGVEVGAISVAEVESTIPANFAALPPGRR
jgi:tetratricopeptide (TPR) repeat protein